jgi:hypothetical protein
MRTKPNLSTAFTTETHAGHQLDPSRKQRRDRGRTHTHTRARPHGARRQRYLTGPRNYAAAARSVPDPAAPGADPAAIGAAARIGAALTGRSAAAAAATGGEEGSGGARVRVASPLAVPLRSRCGHGRGGEGRWWGEVAWVRTARLVSSSPFYRSFCFPPALAFAPLRSVVAGERCLACRDAVVVVCFYLCGGRPAFFNRPRCPAIAVLGWIGKAEGGGGGNA